MCPTQEPGSQPAARFGLAELDNEAHQNRHRHDEQRKSPAGIPSFKPVQQIGAHRSGQQKDANGPARHRRSCHQEKSSEWQPTSGGFDGGIRDAERFHELHVEMRRNMEERLGIHDERPAGGSRGIGLAFGGGMAFPNHGRAGDRSRRLYWKSSPLEFAHLKDSIPGTVDFWCGAQAARGLLFLSERTQSASVACGY